MDPFKMKSTWILSALVVPVLAQNRDLFNYDTTVGNNYGPQDWIRVQCANKDICLGWPETWEYALGWDLNANSECRWCPEGGPQNCGAHHQSPIRLDRNVIDPNNPRFRECEDSHWMYYIDSSCTWDELVRLNAITVERHALLVRQPIARGADGQYRLQCEGGAFGRTDFPKGFPHEWYLSHVDFKMPSEHVQHDKRYAGEVQFYQFYSDVTGGTNNEMGTISVFLDASDKHEDWPVLNKLICQWRRHEEANRERCGMGSVTSYYPGCWDFDRISNNTSTSFQGSGRRMEENNAEAFDDEPIHALDLILRNHVLQGNESFVPRKLHLGKQRRGEELDVDELLKSGSESSHGRRHLINYEHVDWHNYFAMVDVRTEYFFRYTGTQTIPPCYGRFLGDGTVRQTNHWRVMKDPIRISQRQANEMNRLLRERIAPPTDPLAACRPDTAAKVNPDGTVNVARPLQYTHDRNHFLTFCECHDWRSKFPEDQEWCTMGWPERVFQNPYNFATTDRFFNDDRFNFLP